MKNLVKTSKSVAQRRKGAKAPQKTAARILCVFASLRDFFCYVYGAQRLVMAFLFAAGVLLSTSLFAQIRTGASFLRIMPGARQQGIAASTTGVIDELYTIYANPGATGFLREWQWSASYSKWIADVYSASAFYGQRVRMPWSAHLRLGLGIAYQGMPDFDSSDRAAPQVSASDVVFAASVGQPFMLWKRQFAFGANIKYLDSELAQYGATAWMVDLGLLYRSQRFQLFRPGSGFLEYGIISAGLAWTNLGKELTYIATATPLPRTLRAGMALQAGTHEGFQFHFAFDYHKTYREKNEFSLGTEISWNQLLSLRGGYDFENQLISPIAFGLSLRLDDKRMPINSAIPGRNNALRFDFAVAEDNLLFSRPYRGSITHHAIAPEKFRPLGPVFDAGIEADSVVLAWEASRDPDLYDDARYWLFVDQDSLKMANMIAAADRNAEDLFGAGGRESFLVNVKLSHNSFMLKNLEGGSFYWTVAAFDRDRHIRFIEKEGRRLHKFRIIAPQAEITNITFDYDPWITEDDYQGVIKLTVQNTGGRHLSQLSLVVYDSVATLLSDPFSARNGNGHAAQALQRTEVSDLPPGATKTVQVDWRTNAMGRHFIKAALDEEHALLKNDGANRTRAAVFFTIPKGRLATADSVNAFILSRVAFDVPFIPEICFDPGSAEVKSEYLRSWVLEPPLLTLANRLKSHRDVRISLQGFADPNSNENEVALAEARAAAVRDSLLQLGVLAEQMSLLPGQVLPGRRTPANADDARWVMQERRHVKIAAETASEAVVFDLVAFDDIEPLPQPVTFHAAIRSPVTVQASALHLHADDLNDQIILSPGGNEVQGNLVWQHDRAGQEGLWKEKNLTYELTLTDSLSRVFRTRPRQAYLAAKTVLRAQRVAWPIKFNATVPLYDFYWQKMFEHVKFMLTEPTMRMRLSGHACAIGPDAVNMRLSQQRAEAFRQGFLRHAQETFPDTYEKILQRLVSVKGFGEGKPLGIDHLKGDVTIKGDNETPLGRKLNRRIEVEFYFPDKE
jgi:outer membrane protein OmpA-like peptidoglycan-associated protein